MASFSKENSNNFLLMKIVDILFSHTSTDTAVYPALAALGNYFQASRVVILDCFSTSKPVASHDWYSENAERDSRPLPQINNADEYVLEFSAERLLVCRVETADKTAYDSIQFAFMDKEHCCGFLSLDDFSANRIWSDEDIAVFASVAKCIGAYFAVQCAQIEKDYFTNTDGLTNIWNLNKFSVEAFNLLGKNPQELFALVSLDIKRFRYFNEKMGYKVGDAVLGTFGSRLKGILDAGELLARAGGAQFILLLRYTDFKSFQERMDIILKSLGRLRLDTGVLYKFTFSAGVYVLCGTNLPFSACLDRAVFARSSAKKTYKSTIVFFDEKMEQDVLLEKFIEENVEGALMRGEFFVLYQPKVRLQTGTLIGAEALIRWQSREKGLIQPDDFIPILEKNGFVVEVDLFLLDEVCKKICEWKNRLPDIIMAVNFSRVHLEQKDSLSRALRILKHWNVSPERIEIEITESAFSADPEEVTVYVKRLQQAGFKVAMDDFGSGYSSLTMLNNLAFDVVKLDRDFLCRKNSARERIVLDNIIRMAHDLGISVIAEGVETDDQATLLRSVNCESAQGYLFAKPITVEQFEKLL